MLVCRSCRSIYQRAGKFCGIDGQPLVELESDPLIGERIDRYDITELIGRGGMGSVYKAFHRELETDMAIKVLFGDLGSDPTFVARFRREAQVASKIRSPFIVSVVDFGSTPEGLTYLVMEFIKGSMLDEVCALEGALEPKRSARIVADVAAGLSVVHRMGYVHRDVKPANIALVQDAGREMAKLLDFGIVQVARSDDSTKLTGADMIVGTPAYMSPEQAMGDEVTAKADLYSLGVVLYELISGKKPYAGNRSEVLSMLASERPQPLPLGKGDSLSDLTFRLLEKDPNARPESAAEVAELATKISTETKTATTRVGPTPRRKGSNAAIAGVAAAVGAVALGTTFMLGGLSAQAPNDEPAMPTSTAVEANELERELAATIRARGLTLEDLAELAETRPAYAAWLAERARDPAAGKDALLVLQKAAREAHASKELVARKLEGLDAPLAEHEKTLAPEAQQAVRNQYLELFKRLNTDTDFDALARDVAVFRMTISRGAQP